MGARQILLFVLLASIGGAAFFIFKQGEKIGQLEGRLKIAEERLVSANNNFKSKSNEADDLRKALAVFRSSVNATDKVTLRKMCERGDFFDPEAICKDFLEK